MNWFFIALIAPFLWSLVNIVDQFLVSKYGKKTSSVGALSIFSSLVGFLIAFVLILFMPEVFNVPLKSILFLLFSGILTTVWVLFYLFALEHEDVSSIVPWFLTVPVFGYFFGYIFFGETLTLNQQVGSLIVILGVAFLSFDFSKKNQTKLKLKTVVYMSVSCFVVALVGAVFKKFASIDDFWVASFWVYLGLGFSGLFIFLFSKKYRNSFLEMIKTGGVKIVSLNILSEFMSVSGNLLTSFATLLAPLVMVYLVGSFQPGILLILTLLLTRFFPHVVKENLDKRVLYPKIFGILVVILGSIVLFL